MEAQILLYYFNLFKKFILIIFVLLSLFFFFIFFSTINVNENIKIEKGSNLNNISSIILKNENFYKIKIYQIYLRLWDKFIDNIKYGEFKFEKDMNLYEVTKIISKPSNVNYKITIIEGWEEYQISNLFINRFNNNYKINYDSILAETYIYNSTDNLKSLINLMKKNKNDFFINNENKSILKKYSINEIMIIGSLVEKEAKSELDKKLISSVIFNRLNNKMKLQIDATTIFSITKGKRKFNRNLTYKDLKILDDYNTYHIKGLPPSPICYVGRKTIEIVLENYKSDYLFYFYDKNLKNHIFSKNFEEHKKKLNQYRKLNE